MTIKWPLNGVCVRVAPRGYEITIKLRLNNHYICIK